MRAKLQIINIQRENLQNQGYKKVLYKNQSLLLNSTKKHIIFTKQRLGHDY